MIRAADIREWRTHDVVDPKGHKIGVLEAVYVDTGTDEPAVVTVRTGLPTRWRLVRRAPAIGTDDILPAEQEEAIFQHYGMTYQPGANGERKLARR